MEKKNSMEETAAAVQTFRRKEVEGELNFVSDLDALDAALETDNIVARFVNPIDPEADPIDFEMTPMTPGQMAIYYQTLLGHTFLEAASGGIQNPELDDEQRQQLEDELVVKKYDDNLLNILESCIISHPGLTAERMRKWDPYYIMSLHNALMKGSRPSKDVARFPAVDPAGGE